MEPKDRIDTFGALALVGFSAIFGINQVVAKVAVDGFQPVFFAGLRSAGSFVLILLWLRWRGMAFRLPQGAWPSGMLLGLFFSAEFLLLFPAIDLTTVTRVSILFYSMPVWAAIGAHFLIPGERMTLVKSAGLVLAFAGLALAIGVRGVQGEEASLAGDLLALGAAIAWAGIAITAKIGRIRTASAEQQLMMQLGISTIVVLVAAQFTGPLIRELAAIHVAGLLFQIVVLTFLGFLGWFWMLKIYPAASVVSFSFLAPVFGVIFGWLLLDEPLGPSILAALALVAAGLILINRPAGGWRR